MLMNLIVFFTSYPLGGAGLNLFAYSIVQFPRLFHLKVQKTPNFLVTGTMRKAQHSRPYFRDV
jgi:hypothetical protein